MEIVAGEIDLRIGYFLVDFDDFSNAKIQNDFCSS
jgi:hypothetical protein